MAKNLKLKIKNAQLAEALNLKKKPLPKKKKEEEKKPEVEQPIVEEEQEVVEKKPKKATDQPTFLQKKPEQKPAKPAAEKAPSKLTRSYSPEDKTPPKSVAPPAPGEGQVGYIRPGTDRVGLAKKREEEKARKIAEAEEQKKKEQEKAKAPAKKFSDESKSTEGEQKKDHKRKTSKFKEFKESKALKKFQQTRAFDSRDRQGLRANDDGGWRRRRHQKVKRVVPEEEIIRPASLHIKLPITVKDLAAQMKRKSAELIQKLFMQGAVVMINDYLDDETTVLLIGEEFGCTITIDTSEEERLAITGKTIAEEIAESPADEIKNRAPIITFMGHVDHGKTSLIDAFRKSNLTAGEAGAITQHIGAFRCKTPTGGMITLLDTPGHEAFTAMRSRGANLTDLIILVVAGDEGMKQQTDEALELAKEAKVPIIVAINKCDKPGFNAEEVYRQLADREMLPEAWGGETVTVNCSAVSKQGMDELLELVLLQSDLLELKSNPTYRARGAVIEAEMQKGLGLSATLLVQNGTLKKGDSLVIEHVYGRIKTMHDDKGKLIDTAEPSIPVKVTGLSDLPEVGSEFIVVESEKEARKLSKERSDVSKRVVHSHGTSGLEGLMQAQQQKESKKILNIILKTDVHGSIEAIQNAIKEKIKSEKAEINVISADIGAISESDIQLAAASNAVIIGFHVNVEMHAESLIKETKVAIHTFDVIYHLIDKCKEMLTELLDKVREENHVGTARVQQIFKSSHLGIIAGCIVVDGIIKRTYYAKLMRKGEKVWEGNIASLKRVKEDVKEVSKGIECGILLQNYTEIQPEDEIEAYEITYVKQEL